ncbi:MAG TPA: hypothetical protein PKH77_21840 [Anaerolineae bacterium]|nr:hypothetical protein [Anaerolineae bacterium]
MTLAAGQLLQNRYHIMALLGQGGMGAVYRAWDMRLNVAVALKEMLFQPGRRIGRNPGTGMGQAVTQRPGVLPPAGGVSIAILSRTTSSSVLTIRWYWWILGWRSYGILTIP